MAAVLAIRRITFLVCACTCLAEEATGDLNVYDQPLSACGDAGECAYAPDMVDAGAHQVCVTALPDKFSTATGQGDWSDEVAGQPWCICIWAYSNFVLQHGDDHLPVDCKAVPDKVLVSEYSLDNFKQCGSMASECNSYDQAIQKMCSHCSLTAPDEAAKQALDKKCDALTGSLSQKFAEDSLTDRSVSLSVLILAGGLSPLAAVSAVLVYRRSSIRRREDDTEGSLPIE
mmetsp:Transcript_57782/g.135097  ORF Transcript_57782/g.135097 Transcript_57782/m.135097 type:complete len:230 (+) Transcript_57782:54-743(+)